jgi:hypothetical protein
LEFTIEQYWSTDIAILLYQWLADSGSTSRSRKTKPASEPGELELNLNKLQPVDKGSGMRYKKDELEVLFLQPVLLPTDSGIIKLVIRQNKCHEPT